MPIARQGIVTANKICSEPSFSTDSFDFCTHSRTSLAADSVRVETRGKRGFSEPMPRLQIFNYCVIRYTSPTLPTTGAPPSKGHESPRVVHHFVLVALRSERGSDGSAESRRYPR